MTLEDFITFRLKDNLKGLYYGDEHLEVSQCGFYHHENRKSDGYLCLRYSITETHGFDTHTKKYYLECSFCYEYLPKSSYFSEGLSFKILGFKVHLDNADDDDMKVLGEVMRKVKRAIQNIPLVNKDEMKSIGVELEGLNKEEWFMRQLDLWFLFH